MDEIEKNQVDIVNIVNIAPLSRKEEVKFYYNREERLKKFRRGVNTRKRGLFRKRRKGLIIIFIDLFIIALVLYFLNKPVKVYTKKSFQQSMANIKQSFGSEQRVC